MSEQSSEKSQNIQKTVWMDYESRSRKEGEGSTLKPLPTITRWHRNFLRWLSVSLFGLSLILLAVGIAMWARLGFGIGEEWLISLGVVTFLISIIAALTSFLSIRITTGLDRILERVHEKSIRTRLSKEEVKELAQIKNDYFNSVSHEFRTPITLSLGPIRGVLTGRHGVVSESIRQQLKSVSLQQERLLQLINQILDAAKLEAGIVKLQASVNKDVNAYLASRVEQFRPLALQNKIDLRLNLDPGLKGKEVYLDQEKTDKVLNNLLSNAFKFTQEGFIEVSSKVVGNQMQIQVKDSGVGIREDQLEGIFDRFRQAEGSVSEEFAGSGLGLSLVREYTRLHGGEAQVDSKYGRGTVFTLSFPLGKSHLDPGSILEQPVQVSSGPKDKMVSMEILGSGLSAQAIQELNQEMGSQLEKSKKTVLCVDDQGELLKYVRDLLQGEYNVFLASNGAEGWEALQSYRPDLVLSDLMMPVMDGMELCRKIRESQEFEHLPFVLLTAKADMDTKISGLKKGADDYLAKPFSEAELLARVKNLLKIRDQQIRIKKELEAAKAIQQSMLPEKFNLEGKTKLEFLFYPSEDLSGDFCDIIPCQEWVYFYLADVTSHGTASAQVTYLLKDIFLESLSSKDPPNLSGLLKVVSQKYGAYQLEYGVGLQMARYHHEKKILKFLRYNSPSPFRVDAKGEKELLTVHPSPSLSDTNSLPESKLERDIQVFEKELKPGDQIYFFTDGCYEFHPDRHIFGLKGFHKTLLTLPESGWSEELLRKLKEVNQSENFSDDLTVMRLSVI